MVSVGQVPADGLSGGPRSKANGPAKSDDPKAKSRHWPEWRMLLDDRTEALRLFSDGVLQSSTRMFNAQVVRAILEAGLFGSADHFGWDAKGF